MVKKSEFIWNTFASIISSLVNAVVLLFCTRINGTEAAGIFSIAFATAIILNAVGDYGIRIYQVTDSKRKYQFGEYLSARIVVVVAMVLVGIGFVLIRGYELEKLVVCMALILFKAVDNLSESYQAEFQIQGRLDIGGKSVVIRNIVAMIVFFIVDLITKNMIVATIAMFITNLILLVVYDFRWIRKFTEYKIKLEKKVIYPILKECFPLFSSTILSMYINNAVKYAIDSKGNYEMQTFYNIIYLPTFTINLVSIFIIKPLMKSMGDYWNDKEYSKFLKIVAKMIGIMLVVTALIELVCATIALPILSFIYGVELGMYKIPLLILVASGFFYAVATLLFYALGAMRKQGLCMIAYVTTSIVCFILPPLLVDKWQMMGAAISNFSVNVFLVVILGMIFGIHYKKSK